MQTLRQCCTKTHAGKNRNPGASKMPAFSDYIIIFHPASSGSQSRNIASRRGSGAAGRECS